ncbi:MAG: hypothetical protein S4CHLAM37_14950 [Chlamydiia bacterium]|nr:hypothetical protein [Chlamydiia bacterium]
MVLPRSEFNLLSPRELGTLMRTLALDPTDQYSGLRSAHNYICGMSKDGKLTREDLLNITGCALRALKEQNADESVAEFLVSNTRIQPAIEKNAFAKYVLVHLRKSEETPAPAQTTTQAFHIGRDLSVEREAHMIEHYMKEFVSFCEDRPDHMLTEVFLENIKKQVQEKNPNISFKEFLRDYPHEAYSILQKHLKESIDEDIDFSTIVADDITPDLFEKLNTRLESYAIFYFKVFRSVRDQGLDHLYSTPSKAYEKMWEISYLAEARKAFYAEENKEKIESIHHLYLLDPLFKFIPKEIGMLKGLTRLSVKDTEVTTLPEEIEGLTKLTKVIVSGTKIKDLSVLCRLPLLTTLNASNCEVEEIPAEIGDLTNLENFEVANNSITTIPEEFGKLTRLSGLNLSNNKIATVPEGFANLTSLKALGFASNQLTTFPREFLNLASLAVIDLGSNRIDRLPEETPQFAHLKGLCIKDNLITKIPDWIGDLRRIRVLNLEGLDINTLECLLNPKFCKLCLAGTKVTELDEMYNQYWHYVQLTETPFKLGDFYPPFYHV